MKVGINSTCADRKEKRYCKAESVVKPYLKIVANLLHGSKHPVDKVNHILWSNNEQLKTIIDVL